MDDFQKANQTKHDEYELTARRFLCLNRTYIRWAKKKANRIARKQLKQELRRTYEDN